ncbi:MAG: carboxypeptidase regulatory-like domain-containing protein [Bacteroidetes bacterium]|nr:carboxypeptidase regulatory-like domain-containing protein [Bacteroidota bacterium]
MKKLLTVLFLVVIAAWSSFGQVSGYGFGQGTATYTPISGGTVLGTGTIDDNVYTNNPIGFSFTYNGVAYTAFSVNVNGFIAMGTSISSSYTPLSSGSSNNVISALGGDLQGVSGTGELSYLTIGTAPNRTLVVQWTAFRHYSGSGNYNFQIRLEETTNKVVVHYGTMTEPSSYTQQVGIRGASSADFSNRSTTANWLTTTAGATNAASCSLNSTVYPSSGLYFTWALIPPSAPTYSGPANNAPNVLPTATMTWAAGTTGGPTASYLVYFGTDNPPTNIANGVSQTATFYDPTPDMAFNTTYYWKIVSVNGIGTSASSSPVWSFHTTAGFGSLQGFVTNSFGVPISGATVGISGSNPYPPVTSQANGFYQFPVNGLAADTYTVGAQKTGYNTITVPGVVVTVGNVTGQNIAMPQPSMTVLPNPNNISLNPNGMLDHSFTITNAGTGLLTWTATIGAGATGWFSMPAATGTVNPSTQATVSAVFDATGLAVGTLKSTTVTFTSSPDVGTITVPVNMIVAGEPLNPVTNLTATLNSALTGDVSLSWTCTPSTGFLYYAVKRNGTQIAIVPSATTYSDVLPAFGTYTYCVSAVYTVSPTSEACADVEWASPTMTWTPSALTHTQFTGRNEEVDLTIGNTGLGTLAFTFPDYTDQSGDNSLAYCTATATACDEFIGRVQVGTLDKSSACDHYSDFTAFSTDLEMNTPTAVTVTNGGNAYSSDQVFIWIDYNHNDTFDASELTTLASQGGGSSFTGNITVPLTATSGITTMRVRMSYNLAANACGSQTYGEVEDYHVNLKAPSFVTAVAPATGTVAAGGSKLIRTTFSSTGPLFSPAGTYNAGLKLNSNDLANASVTIPCTMTVIVPGTIGGTVTNCVTGEPIGGAMVTAGSNVTMTDGDGNYSLECAAGTYDVVFSEIGFTSVTVTGAVVTSGANTVVNAQLCEQPYAPACASAAVDANDTQATVTWCVPVGPYELMYDDGGAENFAAWQVPGNMNGVKFTPKGYPATVVGGKFFVGDGSFPIGGSIIDAPFTVAVYAADGANGLPGTLLDSVPATVTNYGWVNVTGLNAEVASGDFYLVMIQRSLSPNCAPIGVDATLPKAYKSYSRNVGANEPWVLSPYQDFMMHAVVSSPLAGDDAPVATRVLIPGKVKGMISLNKPSAVPGVEATTAQITSPSGYETDAVQSYKLWRISNFDPTAQPSTGTFTLIGSGLTATTYVESGTQWSALPMGWYAYAIKAVYPGGTESEYVYTNSIPHKLFADVTVNVKLICGMVPAEGAVVKFTGSDYPFAVLTQTVPASGTVVFDNMIKGHYTMLVTKGGYTPYSVDYNITANRTIDVIMEDIRYMPRNLFVDDMTLHATWDEPLAIAITENFESGVFPPAGWQATTQGSTGWYATTDGSSAYFTVPAHTTYAIANDDQGGSSNNGCCDYLITPTLDLTNAPSFALNFASFYTGDYGQMAYVEMSTDGGATWTPIYTCSPAATWNDVSVDLSAYSGASGLSSVKFAFHADDAGQYASGWAIDDVSIASGNLAFTGYGVFLDGSLVGNTPHDQRWYDYDPTTINYGQTYVAGVAAIYCSGYSDLDTYTFTSHFLYPPRNLTATSPAGQPVVILNWQAPLTGDYSVVGSIPRTNTPLATAEYSPMVTQRIGSDNQTAVWDVLLTFPTTSAGKAGVASDGNFIYTTIWSGGGFQKYDLSGNWVEDFDIAGVNSIRDLAYNTDNHHFYGSPNSAVLYEMDFTNKVLVGSVTTGVTGGIRHIAYSPLLDGGNGGFYCGAWSDDFQIKMDGTVIGATPGFTAQGLTGVYGSAYDWGTSGGPFMWYFDQGGNGADIWQYDIAAGAFTGFVQDASTLPGFIAGSIAGGLDYNTQIVPGHAVLLGLIQQDFVFEYDMGGAAAPPSTSLVRYNLYRDGDFSAPVAQIPATELTYWDTGLDPQQYCYDISAVYDLTSFGFPGQFGESVKEGTACANVHFGKPLPFFEDWTSGTFSLNEWTADPNWVLEGQVGNPMPSAKFKWDPLLNDYTSSLTSTYLDAEVINTTTPYKLWMDFDLKLDDRTSSTNEKLSIEVSSDGGATWAKVGEVANNGNMDWTAEHIDITTKAKNKVFQVRFNANGTFSGDIFYWYVDNIHIYAGYIFNPPINLVTEKQGNPQNDIKLTWGPPAGGGTIVTYVIDDNSAENGWAINPGYESWLGNEFAVTDAGVLQSLDVYWQANASAGTESLSFDIFDASNTLIGSSDAFATVQDNWQTVALPDVPFDGTFYAMVHWNMLAGQSNYLGSDENGPNAAANYGWYYDGTAWSHLSDFGYAPCVFLIRAKALVGGDKKVVSFGPVSHSNGTPSANFSNVIAKSERHSSAGAPVSSSAVFQGDNSQEMLGYNIYRRYYIDPIPGQYTTYSAWDSLTFVTATEYLDMNLFNDCYDYYVTAVYTEGQSVPSNESEQCLTVGLNTNETSEVRIYPNPAVSFVTIDLTKDVRNITIYNALGSVVNEKNITRETSVTVNTSNYAAGAYNVKFTTANGDTFSRKFVVTK